MQRIVLLLLPIALMSLPPPYYRLQDHDANYEEREDAPLKSQGFKKLSPSLKKQPRRKKHSEVPLINLDYGNTGLNRVGKRPKTIAHEEDNIEGMSELIIGISSDKTRDKIEENKQQKNDKLNGKRAHYFVLGFNLLEDWYNKGFQTSLELKFAYLWTYFMVSLDLANDVFFINSFSRTLGVKTSIDYLFKGEEIGVYLGLGYHFSNYKDLELTSHAVFASLGIFQDFDSYIFSLGLEVPFYRSISSVRRHVSIKFMTGFKF